MHWEGRGGGSCNVIKERLLDYDFFSSSLLVPFIFQKNSFLVVFLIFKAFGDIRSDLNIGQILGTFPKSFSQVATSQLCNFPSNFSCLSQPQYSSPQTVLAAALALLACSSRSAQLPSPSQLQRLAPQSSLRRLITFRKLPLGKFHIWEVAAWEIVIMEFALGNLALGKYLTPL